MAFYLALFDLGILLLHKAFKGGRFDGQAINAITHGVVNKLQGQAVLRGANGNVSLHGLLAFVLNMVLGIKVSRHAKGQLGRLVGNGNKAVFFH